MPRVSVVVPSYNYERYLRLRLDSLVRQTFRDFEIIVVDDGSTDNSAEVVRQYESEGLVRAAYHTRNSGLTYRRWNEGAMLATGDYLLFAGADDYCDRSMLERLAAAATGNDNVAFAYCDSVAVDADGNRIGDGSAPETAGSGRDIFKRSEILEGAVFAKYLLRQNVVPCASAVLVDARCFLAEHGFDEAMPVLADWDLWMRLCRRGRVAHVPERLNYFRFHQNTVRAHAAVMRRSSSIDDRLRILLSGLQITGRWNASAARACLAFAATLVDYYVHHGEDRNRVLRAAVNAMQKATPYFLAASVLSTIYYFLYLMPRTRIRRFHRQGRS